MAVAKTARRTTTAARYAAQPFAWDDVAGRYRDRRTGRYLTPQQVDTALRVALERAGQRARDVTIALRESRIALGTWEREMRAIVKDTTLYGVAAASGGWRQMGAAEYGRAGQIIRTQYGHLARYADALARGTAPIHTGRSALYAHAGRVAFADQRAVEMATRDYLAERNVLGFAEHCPDCRAQSARGWVRIGGLVPIGRRRCLARCKCRVTYRKTPPPT